MGQEGKTRKEFACTLDVSRKGALLANVKGLQGTGQLIAVRRRTSEASFRVVWIGLPQTPCEGQIGVECVDPDKIIWDIDFADAHEDFELLDAATLTATPSQASQPPRAKSPNYPCLGTARVWASEFASKFIEVELTAIGLSGAELNVDGLPFNDVVLLQMQIGDTNLTVKGVMRVQDGASRKLVEFWQIRRGDRRVLQRLVAQLSTPKGKL